MLRGLWVGLHSPVASGNPQVTSPSCGSPHFTSQQAGPAGLHLPGSCPFAMHTLKKKKFFLFCIGAETINNVVRVSGEQQRDSAIYIHVSILPQIPLPSRLPHNTEQSSLGCTLGPCCLSILNIVVRACGPQTP